MLCLLRPLRVLASLLLLGSGVAACSDPRADAYAACQRAIEPHLATPASARYPALDSEDLRASREYEAYDFVGSLDSQNAFGALLRTEFSCRTVPDGDDWRIVYLRLGDHVVEGL